MYQIGNLTDGMLNYIYKQKKIIRPNRLTCRGIGSCLWDRKCSVILLKVQFAELIQRRTSIHTAAYCALCNFALCQTSPINKRELRVLPHRNKNRSVGSFTDRFNCFTDTAQKGGFLNGWNFGIIWEIGYQSRYIIQACVIEFCKLCIFIHARHLYSEFILKDFEKNRRHRKRLIWGIWELLFWIFDC